MDVVQALVPANGVHVGIQTVAGVETVALEGQPLPFGQGMNHLALGPAHGGDVEAYGALHTVEVVVEAGVFVHEQRRGNPAEIQSKFQILLKTAFDKLDGPLHVVTIERGAVALGNGAGIHKLPPVLEKILDGYYHTPFYGKMHGNFEKLLPGILSETLLLSKDSCISAGHRV